MSKVISNVVKIELAGKFSVSGVFNTNGSVKKSDGSTSNVVVAKKDSTGRDYTSAGCIRQLMFKEEIPYQPSKADLKNQVAQLAGSAAGYVRGLMVANKGGSGGWKKETSVCISDAYTIAPEGKRTTHMENRTNSKPKESNEEEGDTSLFSKENAGVREQNLSLRIKIDHLQRAVTEGDGSIVPKEKVEEFKQNLSQSLLDLGASGVINEVNHKPAKAVYSTTQMGVLLTQEQQAALVKYIVNKALLISGERNGSTFDVMPETIEAKIYSAGSLVPTSVVSVQQLIEMIDGEQIQFQEFYKAV